MSIPELSQKPVIRFWVIGAILLSLLAFLLPACGRTTRPSDLSATQTAQAPPGVKQVVISPAATVAGTHVALPLIIQKTTLTPAPTQTFAASSTPTQELAVRFAVIGDYGGGGAPEADVAALVGSWQPDFIITLGDNNYPDGEASTIDANIGQFYHSYIYPYIGGYGDGADQNRFFPTLGNHDWTQPDAQPYLDYFTLPGNERYYDFSWGPIHFFALDSDSREPDGVGSSSPQAVWLQERLAASTAPWKIVYMHHPPYSSGLHGSVDWTRWSYQEWGADAVLSGHDHTYERLTIGGFPYFVNSLGGGAIYNFVNILEGSQARFNDDYGAMLVEANSQQMTFQFITRQGEVVDSYSLQKTP